MSVTLELPENLLADIRAEATLRGVSVDVVVTERLLAERLFSVTVIENAAPRAATASDLPEHLKPSNIWPGGFPLHGDYERR